MNNQKTSPKKEISWQALEYPEYKKNPFWFVLFGLVVALLVLFGIYTDSWTTAILFLLCGIIGIVYSSQKPKTVNIALNATGVRINSLFYSHKTIKKFWIIYNPEVKTLYLETTAYLDRIIRIELANQDPVEIKNFLSQYLEEDLEHEETFSDRIARKMKF